MKLALMCIAMTVFQASPAALPPSDYKPAFTLSLIADEQRFVTGTKPMISVAVNSTTDILQIAERQADPDCAPFRIYLLNSNGSEPEKTEFYRHFLGEIRSGDGPDQSGGSCFNRPLMAGGTLLRHYDLSHFYQPLSPGSYTAYLVIDDVVVNKRTNVGTSHPVKSNTVHFEIVGAK